MGIPALDVNGGIVCSPNTAGKDTFELSTNAVNEGRLRIKNVDTTTVQIRAGGDSYFNGGNVGIGTTSPTTLLEISGDTTTWAGMSKIYLTDVNSNASSRNWSIGNGGTAFGSLSFITSNAADGVPADSTGTAVMSMDGVNKKVGINLAAPTTYLDVRAPSGVSSPNVAYFKSDQHGLGVYVNIGSTFSEIRSNNNSYPLVLNASSGGNVGIGTASTSAKLHVKEAANNSEGDAHVRIEGSGYSAFQWLDGTAYYIGQNSGNRVLRMYSSGNTAGVNLAADATSWGTFSDERLKENIQDIGSVTDKIKDIRCVTYNRKDIEGSHQTIGFIAQDFVGKFDQVLDKSKLKDDEEEEYYSIKYTETIPVLLKAIQEQQTIIDDLKSRIETLEG